MEAADSIVFVIQNETTVEGNNNQPETTGSTVSEISESDSSILKSTLKKVASGAIITEVLSGRKRLTEEDIDVQGVSFLQDERLTLYSKCRDFFSQDAWTAVGHHIKDTGNASKNLIFPLYTEAADEDFWLFYCPGQTLASIDNARPSTKLKGYWLDRKETGNIYTILPSNDEIKVKWIIKTDHGPLYYEKSINASANGDDFEIPFLFKNCIRITLQKYGFLRG